MADQKLADLTSGAPAAATDLIYAVKDPAGTPTDAKLTLGEVIDLVEASPNSFTAAQTITPLTDAAALTVRRNSGSQTSNIFQVQTEANAALASIDKSGNVTGGTYNKVTITAPATSATLTIADGKTLTASNTLTLAGTDSTTMTFPSTSATLARTDAGNTFTGDQTISSGSLVLSGNISSAAWTTNGIRHKSVAATLTDTSSSGTVSAAYTNVYGGNTIAASNSATFTDYFTTFISEPTAGTNVTLTNKWALGLSGNLRVGGNATLAGGTITADAPVLNATQTWNSSGVTFTGLKLNVTDTASASGSLLMDLQVGGNSKFSVSKAGKVLASAGINIGSASDNATLLNGSGYTLITNLNGGSGFGASQYGQNLASAGYFSANGTRFGVNSNTQFAWSNSSTDVRVSDATFDLFLTRRAAANLRLGAADAAAPVAQTLSVQSVVAGTTNTAGANLTITGSQGTGTGAGGSIIFQVAPAGSSGTAQNSLVTFLEATAARAFNLYNTTDVTTNYERGYVRWANNTFEIGTEKAGTGSNRQTWLYGGGGAAMILTGSSVNFYQTPLPSSNGAVNIGSSSSNWANLYMAGFTEVVKMTAPTAPAANKVRIYAEDNGAGKTRLMALFATGAAQQIAIEP